MIHGRKSFISCLLSNPSLCGPSTCRACHPGMQTLNKPSTLISSYFASSTKTPGPHLSYLRSLLLDCLVKSGCGLFLCQIFPRSQGLSASFLLAHDPVKSTPAATCCCVMTVLVCLYLHVLQTVWPEMAFCRCYGMNSQINR